MTDQEYELLRVADLVGETKASMGCEYEPVSRDQRYDSPVPCGAVEPDEVCFSDQDDNRAEARTLRRELLEEIQDFVVFSEVWSMV